MVRTGAEETDVGDEFFEKHLSAFQRSAIGAACVDTCEWFRQSLREAVAEVPSLLTTSSTFCSMPAQAVDEVRRAEFFRKGGAARDLVRGSAGCF